MRSHFALLVVAAAGAVALGFAFVPDENEEFAILQRDRHYNEALNEIRRQYDAGRQDAHTILDLHRLYVHFGDLENATLTLERYVKLRPEDDQALLQLAEHYKHAQQRALYARTLEALFDRSPTAEIYGTLLGLHRLDGAFEKERAVLEQGASLGIAQAPDLVRLGLLAAQRGALRDAVKLLTEADEGLPPEEVEGRLALFRVLVDSGRHDEAMQRANLWSKRWKAQDHVAHFMFKLAEAGRLDLALRLSRGFSAPGNEVMLTSIHLLADHGETDQARHLLRQWADPASISDLELALEGIDIALSLGDHDTALAVAHRLPMRRVPDRVFIRVAIETLEVSRHLGLSRLPKKYLSSLADELVHRTSASARNSMLRAAGVEISNDLLIFGVEIALAEKRLPLAHKLAQRIEPANLSSEELNIWVAVHLAAGNIDAVFEYLTSLWRADRLPDVLVTTLMGIVRYRGAEGDFGELFATEFATENDPVVAPKIN